MKKSPKDYIEIALTLAIIAGLFMPYIYGVLPIGVLFENATDLEALLGLTIPIMVTVPFLLLLIFKGFLRNSILGVLKSIFLILYIIIIADYCYGFYESYNSWIFDESAEFSISIAISLILILLSLKYLTVKSDQLQNILLSIMGLPMILYFVYAITLQLDDFEYGGYIISISFILLYIMAVYSIFKNRKVKPR